MVLFQDGHFIREDSLLVGAENRGFRYGDGLFETIKLVFEQVQLGQFHMERLFAGLQLLEFECPAYFTPNYLLDKIKELVHRNGHGKLARVRLMIYRGNGGIHDPENHYPHHIIQSWSLPISNHQWNENGLVLGVHYKARKSPDILANCKTNNYLPYILASLEAKRQKWNDAVLLNTHQRVCDASIANVFLVFGEKIITPALSEGPVAGIMRQYLLNNLQKNGIDCQETEISETDLERADEIFLTNSMYGLRWVGQLGARKYGSSMTSRIYREIICPLFLSPPAL